MTTRRANLSQTIGKSSQIQSSSAIRLIEGVIKKKKCLLPLPLNSVVICYTALF